MPRELNFRFGRGRARERRDAISLEGFAAAIELISPWSLRWLQYQRAMAARTL